MKFRHLIVAFALTVSQFANAEELQEVTEVVPNPTIGTCVSIPVTLTNLPPIKKLYYLLELM